MTFESMETSLCSALYEGLGQSVTYTAQDAEQATIYSIVDEGLEYVGIDPQASERVVSARVKSADIATPKRGDWITMGSGVVYIVDNVDRENNTEWRLLLSERDR